MSFPYSRLYQEKVLSYCPCQVCSPNHTFVPLSLCPRLGWGRDAAKEQSSNCFPFSLIQVVEKDEITDKARGLFTSSLSLPHLAQEREGEMPWSSALVSKEEESALSGISI